MLAARHTQFTKVKCTMLAVSIKNVQITWTPWHMPIFFRFSRITKATCAHSLYSVVSCCLDLLFYLLLFLFNKCNIVWCLIQHYRLFLPITLGPKCIVLIALWVPTFDGITNKEEKEPRILWSFKIRKNRWSSFFYRHSRFSPLRDRL